RTPTRPSLPRRPSSRPCTSPSSAAASSSRAISGARELTSRLRHHVAAAHGKANPRDEIGQIGGEKRDGVRDVLIVAAPSERDAALVHGAGPRPCRADLCP